MTSGGAKIRKSNKRDRRFRVLVAIDSSREAHSALIAASAFPWPPGTEATGIVALRTPATRGRPVYVQQAFERAFRDTAARAQRILTRRWPRATVTVVDDTPAAAILSEARRRHADVIVLGSRHRGWLAKRLLGSVSTAVVRHAPCSVLVVRGRPRQFTRALIGVDGSRNARRAVALVAQLSPAQGAEATVVRAVEPIRVPAMPLIPKAERTLVAREVATLNAAGRRRVRRELGHHEAALRRGGWRGRSLAVTGPPVRGLLRTAAQTRADLTVLGARSIGGIEQLLLGSVADTILDRSPISVLIVR